MIGYLELIPFILAVPVIILAATWHDDEKRGYTLRQLLLIRFLCLITFPIGLILYMIIRPVVRPCGQAGN